MSVTQRGRLAGAVVAVATALAACAPEASAPGTTPAPPLPSASQFLEARSSGWGVRVVAANARGTVADVALRRDGRSVAVAGQDGGVRVVGPGPARVVTQHDARVLRVAFAPDGRTVASASADGTARLSGDGSRSPVILGGHDAPVVDVLWTADGRHAVTLCVDGAARVFRADDGELVGVCGTSERPLDHLAPLPRSPRFVAASRTSGELLVVRTDGEIVSTVTDLGEGAEHFAVSPVDDVIVVGGSDGRVVTWGPEGHRTPPPHSAAVQDVAFATDGSCFATASLDATARVLTVEGAELLRLEAHGAPLHRVAVLPGAARVLTVGADRRAVLWDQRGRQIAELSGVTDATFVAGGQAVLAWSGDDSGHAITIHGDPLPAPLGTERGVVGRVAHAEESDAFAWIAPDRTARVALADVGGEADATAREHPAEGHASPERCVRCHRPEYARWVRSSHAWTSALASPASLPRDVLAGREVHHPPGVTRFVENDGGWMAETVDESGATARFRLTHVAGHKRMKMLLATMDDGRIQVLPAMTEWPDGPWFDYTHLLYGSPDEDPDTPPLVRPGEASFWTGAVRSWDQKCAICHTSGRLALEPGPDGTGPRSVWRSLGVDCETCHGPGRAHAEAWERGETGAPLQRLEALPRAASIAVCTQCHMEGDRVTPTYRIGDDLYEHLDPTLALSPDRAVPYGRPLELIYDGLPFGTSHCAESGGLTCSRCHEPHGGGDDDLVSQLRLPPTSRDFCGDCHADVADAGRAHSFHDPRGSGGTCVGCHMPFLTIERGHGAVADHTLGIPRLDLPGDRVATDACTWCHSRGANTPPDAPRVGAEALRDAYARWWPDAAPPRRWMRTFAAARSGDTRADADLLGVDLLGVVRDASSPRVVRASAVRLLEPFAASHVGALLELRDDPDSLVRRAAVLALRRVRDARVDAALRASLDDPSRAVRVSAARAIVFGWERARANRALLRAAIPVLEEDVEQVPDDYLRWFLLGGARGLAADEAGALEAYERVLVLDPLAHAVRAHVERLRARVDEAR